uniref:Glycerol-3-phosphate dehydrogenase [NAD(+)] n=1 Tax=Wallemia ichthyophaga TaxID=245174 RepID=E1XUQ4_WALIC|nr:glycerol-3-phosphate dehydrogenase [Wallemia ichthyophaga]
MVKESVAVIGSGNWGSVAARMAGQSCLEKPDLFERDVPMWVFEEQVDGRNLTDIINEKHENVKYLPGAKFPENVIANPDLIDTVEDATLLIIVIPHQFLPKTLNTLKGHINPKARAVSLIKGVEVVGDNINIFAKVIERELGIRCSALSGANIANEIALEKFSETSIGYADRKDGEIFQKLFDRPYFRVSIVEDVEGVSLCGAMKNIVTIACGFNDGMNWGDNTKAAVMRVGLLEMKRFCQDFFPSCKDATFVEESAGVADLITTCLGGRNRKVAAAHAETGKSFEQLEQEILGGQRLQGTGTAKEIHEFLSHKGKVDNYPLFKTVYEIAFENKPAKELTSRL